jgi:CTP:molybdopterin cytidylyltransferase MocA
VPEAVFLLAAGRGLRAGGPKAWMPWSGRPLLQSQLDFIRPRFPAPEVRVSVQEAWVPKCRKLEPAAAWVPVDPAMTALGALQALWRAAPPSGWSFLWHVDMPVWEPGLFDVLRAALPAADAERADAVAPVQDGRKGHPVVLAACLGGDLLALDPAKDRLDHFLRTRRVREVPVPYPCIHSNWNVKLGEPR